MFVDLWLRKFKSIKSQIRFLCDDSLNWRVKLDCTSRIWAIDVEIILDLGFNFEMGCVFILEIEGWDLNVFRYLRTDLAIKLIWSIDLRSNNSRIIVKCASEYRCRIYGLEFNVWASGRSMHMERSSFFCGWLLSLLRRFMLYNRGRSRLHIYVVESSFANLEAKDFNFGSTGLNDNDLGRTGFMFDTWIYFRNWKSFSWYRMVWNQIQNSVVA